MRGFFDDPYDVSDLAVSPPETRTASATSPSAALTGMDAALFRCVLPGLAGRLEGRHRLWRLGRRGPANGVLLWVTDIIFSPSWATDRTILVTTVTYLWPWTTTSTCSPAAGERHPGLERRSPPWASTLWRYADAVSPTWLANFDARAIAGITLPSTTTARPRQRCSGSG
jgi:hypothetical protein